MPRTRELSRRSNTVDSRSMLALTASRDFFAAKSSNAIVSIKRSVSFGGSQGCEHLTGALAPDDELNRRISVRCRNPECERDYIVVALDTPRIPGPTIPSFHARAVCNSSAPDGATLLYPHIRIEQVKRCVNVPISEAQTAFYVQKLINEAELRQPVTRRW